MYSYGSPHTAAQKQDDQQERTFSNYVRIQVVVLKTYLGRWTIGRSGERGSGISVLPARYDDDDIYIYIYSPFNFPHFFVQAFEIVVNFWKFSMSLLYILWDEWPILMISGSNKQLQQELEYTLLKPYWHIWWISKMHSGL